jgi:hypothetical protein
MMLQNESQPAKNERMKEFNLDIEDAGSVTF